MSYWNVWQLIRFMITNLYISNFNIIVLNKRFKIIVYKFWTIIASSASFSSRQSLDRCFQPGLCFRWNGGMSKYPNAQDTLFDQASARDRVRLRCIRDALCTQWLEICPTETLGLRLQPDEFIILLKWWLGLPLLPPDQYAECSSCGEPLDIFGDHLLCCRKAGLIQRHNAVVQSLWHHCTAAGLHATPKVSIDGRTRPADLLLTHWKGGGPCALDIAVVHPLAPSISFATVKTRREAIDSMECIKRVKCAESCEKSNVAFMPTLACSALMVPNSAINLFLVCAAAPAMTRLCQTSDIRFHSSFK